MFITRHLPAFRSAAWVLLACFLTKAQASAAEPAAGKQGPSIGQVIGDLEQRAKKLGEEAAESKALAPEDARARMEISRCLIRLSMLTRNKVIPADPYYRALRRQRLAAANLETARIWWDHCRTDDSAGPREGFESLPLAMELGEEKKKADQEVAAAKPAEAPASGHGRVPLNPAVTARLKQGGGILDQVQNWENLSEESKSKIIAR